MKSLLTQIENLIANKVEVYVEVYFSELNFDQREDKIDALIYRETTKIATKLVEQFMNLDSQ